MALQGRLPRRSLAGTPGRSSGGRPGATGPARSTRTPTDQEWQDFFGHFEKRKVSVGTRGVPSRHPCSHEHACVRCALLCPTTTQAPPLGGHPRQHLRPNTRSTAGRLARGDRGARGQPGRRRTQTGSARTGRSIFQSTGAWRPADRCPQKTRRPRLSSKTSQI